MKPKLNPQLLMSQDISESILNSTLETEAKGSYSPMRFVITLRKDIHQALAEKENSLNKIQAFSTYMHETIHWWQHVGSHSGFITSLSYPAFAHSVYSFLKSLVEEGMKFKSIIKYDSRTFKETGSQGDARINFILNTFFDLHYAKKFILDNKNIHSIVNDERFFLHIGNCFYILWSSSINILSHSIDRDFEFLPKIRSWESEFQRLASSKVKGYFEGSEMAISQLGTHAIFEGQARFNQLQYLAVASENTYSYDDFYNKGMLSGIYVESFNEFLRITGIERPSNLNNGIIALFLLISDISINPTDGFPDQILHFETFIISSDPGMRFSLLCATIKEEKEFWINAVKDYSRSEYIDLAEKLCGKIACFSPLYGSAIVADWAENQTTVKELMKEETEMKFNPENLAVRLFTAKYIRFQQDKLKYPQFFCWTGKLMTSEVSSDFSLELAEDMFDKHKALFIDDENGEIKPMTFKNFGENETNETFQSFFNYNTTFDMINKWIVESGEFKYNYRWLTPNFSDEELKNWIRENFKNAFDIYPEDLTVL